MKLFFCVSLLLASSSCEATLKRRSKLIRGDAEEISGRALAPTGKGKDKDKKKSSKSSKKSKSSKDERDVFSNPEGREECVLTQSTFEIEGPTTVIQGPTFNRFPDCNNLFNPATIDAYYECLADKGVINSPWFFLRDTPGSEFVFTNQNGGTNGSDGSACAKITSGTPSKAEFELWSEEYHGTRLADFTSVSVDYKVVTQSSPATDQYFVNFYVRRNAGITGFYDCNFNFIPDLNDAPTAPTAWRTVEFTLDTMAENKIKWGPSNIANCNYDSLQAFLDEFPDAVIGVGSAGSFESINLVTGQTGQDYTGLEVCWDNVKVATTNQVFVYDFEPTEN